MKNEWIAIFDRLSNEQAGLLIKKVFDYMVFDFLDDKKGDDLVKSFFEKLKKEYDEMRENYEAIKIQRETRRFYRNGSRAKGTNPRAMRELGD